MFFGQTLSQAFLQFPGEQLLSRFLSLVLNAKKHLKTFKRFKGQTNVNQKSVIYSYFVPNLKTDGVQKCLIMLKIQKCLKKKKKKTMDFNTLKCQKVHKGGIKVIHMLEKVC